MFPLRWNFPFRKKDGSVTTIEDAINSGGGGGGGYTLPTASASTKGGVKVGTGLSMDGEVLNNSNPTPYSLPTASAEVLGGVKVGSGLSIENGVLSASGGGGGSTIKTLEATTTSSASTASANSFATFQVQAEGLSDKVVLGARAGDGVPGYKVLAISKVSSAWWSVLAYNSTSSDQSITKVKIDYVE